MKCSQCEKDTLTVGAGRFRRRGPKLTLGVKAPWDLEQQLFSALETVGATCTGPFSSGRGGGRRQVLRKLLKNFVTAVLSVCDSIVCLCSQGEGWESPCRVLHHVPFSQAPVLGRQRPYPDTRGSLTRGEGEVAEPSVQVGAGGQFTDLEA